MSDSPESYKQVNFRVTETEYEQLRFIAAAGGMSVAAFCRAAALEAAPKERAIELLRDEATRLSKLADRLDHPQNP